MVDVLVFVVCGEFGKLVDFVFEFQVCGEICKVEMVENVVYEVQEVVIMLDCVFVLY